MYLDRRRINIGGNDEDKCIAYSTFPSQNLQMTIRQSCLFIHLKHFEVGKNPTRVTGQD